MDTIYLEVIHFRGTRSTTYAARTETKFYFREVTRTSPDATYRFVYHVELMADFHEALKQVLKSLETVVWGYIFISLREKEGGGRRGGGRWLAVVGGCYRSRIPTVESVTEVHRFVPAHLYV